MSYGRLFAALAVGAVLMLPGAVQARQHAEPPSYAQRLTRGEPAPTVVLTPPDAAHVAALLHATPEAGGLILLPGRHGVEQAVNLGTDTAGRWTRVPDGGRLWRLRVHSPGASSLNLVFDAFVLPEGARLVLYDDARSRVLGAFTSANNKPHGGFATDRIPGDATTLEVYVPAGAAPVQLHVSTVVHGLDGRAGKGGVDAAATAASYVPRALACSINATCPAGKGWDDAVGATVNIVMGGATCTGVLLNNTRGDGTPYVLTANHCGAPAVGQVVDWVFQFHYASPTCEDPSTAPEPLSVSGAVVRAAQGGVHDFTLLELLEPIPQDANVHFAGWSIEEIAPAQGLAVGHPMGDLAKLAIDDDPIVTSPYYSGYWMASYDHGVMQVGSSGSPLFNEQHQVIGHVKGAYQLSGTCSGTDGDDNGAVIYHPKLSRSWNVGSIGTRLSDFLDPDGTGLTSVPGRGQESPVWINEVDADVHAKANKETSEFVELFARAGTVLDGYTLDVFACADGAASLAWSQTLAPFVFQDDFDGFGAFVLGGDGLADAVRDQAFAREVGSGRLTDVLPDGSGLLVLRNAAGVDVFSYQYETEDLSKRKRRGGPSGDGAICPPGRATRSSGDPTGEESMGFTDSAPPGPAALATTPLAATPGRPNRGQEPQTASPDLSPFAVGKTSVSAAPSAAVLSQAYPNPFNPQTQFTVAVPRPQRVTVAVYDVLGRRVALLHDGPMAPEAVHTFVFDGTRLASGVYVIGVHGETFTTTRSVTLAK